MSTSDIDIGAIIQGGVGIGETVAGMLITQETQEKLKQQWEDRPIYEVPASIQEQVALLRARSQQGLPGEELISGQIQQGTAQGISASREAATSAADLLGATTNLYGAQTRSLTDLAIQSAQQRSANELAYAQGLGTMAQYQDKAWTWNESLAWQTRRNELMGIQQSAYDMLVGGINTMAQSGANFSGSGQSYQTPSSSLTATQAQPAYSQYQPTNTNIQYGGSTPLTTDMTMGQYQYNPSGGQTLGQYVYR